MWVLRNHAAEVLFGFFLLIVAFLLGGGAALLVLAATKTIEPPLVGCILGNYFHWGEA